MNQFKQELSKCSNNKDRKLIIKEWRRAMDAESRTFPSDRFVSVPLPAMAEGTPLRQALRSRDFLVQIYDQNGTTRISVNRASIKDNGDWEEGISWDTLMKIKRAVGYGDYDAVEVYPRDFDIVDVANIRHLFILKEPLPFIWRTKNG